MPEQEAPAQPLVADSPTDPPTEGLTPDPAPEAAPQAQPKPEGEVAPEAAEKGGAPEPPAWTKAENVDALFDHEEVAPKVKERVDTARQEGHDEGRREAHGRLQPFLERQQATYQEISTGVEKLDRALAKAAKAGGLDQEALSDLLEEHRRTFDVLGGQQETVGFWKGASRFLTALAETADAKDVLAEYDIRFRGLQGTVPDDSFMPDFLKELVKASQKPLKAELEEAKATITRMETETRTVERNGRQPPAEPAGGAGGPQRSDRELKADPTTPVDKLKEIRARERG